MDDEFKVGQLTKQLVAMNLKEIENPCVVAAALVRRTILVALKARPGEARGVISDACYGGMQGLLIADQDLACGALLMLAAVCGPSPEIALGADKIRSYCLEGCARIARFVSKEQLLAIARALERRHPGASQVFTDAAAQLGGRETTAR